MANYDIVSPANLDNLDETQPLGSEDPSLIDDALRQTRTLLKEAFLLEHNADGSHKGAAAAAADPNSIDAKALQSDASDNSKRAVGPNHLQDDAVTNRAMADSSVDTAELVDGAVTETKLADSAVTNNKIGTGAVSAAKVASNGVDAAALASDPAVDANRAVTTDHVRDSAINTAKIADGAVTPGKVSNIGLNRLLVGDGSNTSALNVAGDLTLSISGSDAIFKLIAGTGLNLAKIWESQPAPAARLNGLVNDTSYPRPLGGTTWNKTETSFNMVQISGNNIIVETGTYLAVYGTYMASQGSNNNMKDGQGLANVFLHQARFRDVDTPQNIGHGPLAVGGNWSVGFDVFTIVANTNMQLISHVFDRGDNTNALFTPGDYDATVPDPDMAGHYGAFLFLIRISV